MVEVGSIQIGGSIETAEIERGILRIQGGLKNISNAGKSVESDFERIGARGKKLVSIFGKIALVGGGALLALAKGAPALAGAMAKIQISMMKLKFAAGDALKPTFDKMAEGLNRLSNWVNAHPDLFKGIVNSITGLAIATGALKVGGWIYAAWAGFFGLIKGMVAWTGWSVLATKVGGVASKAAAIIGGGITAGVAGGLAVGGTAAGLMIGPLINTYQREITGEPGFLDRMLQDYNNYLFSRNLNRWSRNRSELDQQYFV